MVYPSLCVALLRDIVRVMLCGIQTSRRILGLFLFSLLRRLETFSLSRQSLSLTPVFARSLTPSPSVSYHPTQVRVDGRT